jgi:hypothetical protein
MKKLIMVFAIVGACTTAAVAQDSSATTKTPSDKMTTHQGKDFVTLKDGKVLVVKGGAASALGNDLTLPNGTVIKTDGTVKSSDGTTLKLQEGEKIDMEGKLLKKEDSSAPQK